MVWKWWWWKMVPNFTDVSIQEYLCLFIIDQKSKLITYRISTKIYRCMYCLVFTCSKCILELLVGFCVVIIILSWTCDKWVNDAIFGFNFQLMDETILYLEPVYSCDECRFASNSWFICEAINFYHLWIVLHIVKYNVHSVWSSCLSLVWYGICFMSLVSSL